MGFFEFFRQKKHTFQRWKELGRFTSTFTVFGDDAYKSDTVRSCIRPLSSFTGKAKAKSSNARIERILNVRPNLYMSGNDFLKKVRNRYELYNNCFIYIQRDDTNTVTGYYPVPYEWLEALESGGELFIRFHFTGSVESIVLPWADLAVMRKDYIRSDITGDGNEALIKKLQMIHTTNEGLSNAIKATANLRGIIKSTKAMLKPEDVKAQKERFVKDYLNLENAGGIASLDATQDFVPITMSPTVANWEQSRELREDVYRYFGVNDDIVMCKLSPDQIEVFYEMSIEPFLVALATELTSKTFTERELGFGNYIVFEANKLQFASLTKKIQMFKEVVLNGGMLPDEWREACNMGPLPDGIGKIPIRRLDVAAVDDEKGDDEDAD